mmetsp:Transcript_29631/g.60554  ORF Transcript_29631/g.60554 Transcript_29631/m.60554 type:complete len:158 (-) Transcript_29631:247-720(-)
MIRWLTIFFTLKLAVTFSPRTTRSSPRARIVVEAGDFATQVAQDVMDLTSAFGGGTIGVVGTLATLQMKKREVKQRSQCPYCTGCGQLTCAKCLGGGSVTMVTGTGSVGAKQSCPSCDGNGFITCVNCKGDGRIVPTMLDGTVSRDPESELEDLGMT